MDKNRREYAVKLVVNGIRIDTVVIDTHYEEKHAAVINDKLFLNLVKLLNNKYYRFDDYKFPFKYFVHNKLTINGKSYRLIWLLEENKSILGVVNTFRSSK